MIKNDLTNRLENLFKKWAKENPVEITRLADSGSNRKYFRIKGSEKTAIGVYSSDDKENKAFITFTKHFLKKGLNVPTLYAQNLKEKVYLIEDLGDETLFNYVMDNRNNLSAIRKNYERALEHLIRFQVDGGKGFDYSVCYPRKKFDEQSILWDLNYFKYYFLKPLKIHFDEKNLEDDFYSFAKLLMKAESNYFLYRDFQARNILLKNSELYFFDYQGGRKGSLQYDVASLLFQAQINLSPAIREELIEFYLSTLIQKSNIKSHKFRKYFYPYVVIRLLQTFGAYGFRGFYENKTYFLKSIPYAINNLSWLIESNLLPLKFKELQNVLTAIVHNNELKKFKQKDHQKLTVAINSFSYKKGIPVDYTGNGGGFVFDCRALNNPGRYPEFSHLTGKDESVIRFIETQTQVNEFLNSVYSLVDEAVENYIKRDFKNLNVNFGCTGGQHRSVYCADKLAEHLKNKFDVYIELNHTQLSKEELI